MLPNRLHLWGTLAGALGFVANVLTDDQGGLTDEQRRSGAAVVGELDRLGYHLGVVAGIGAVFSLVLLASSWRRWLAAAGHEGAIAGAIPTAIGASAAALLVGYGVKGALAEYLPGGINDDNFDRNGVYVLFVLNDTLPWYGWWGVLFAAALCAWLAFTSQLMPRWLGIVSALALVPPLAVLVVSGAVAIAGVVAPLWLVVASLALAWRRDPAEPT